MNANDRSFYAQKKKSFIYEMEIYRNLTAKEEKEAVKERIAELFDVFICNILQNYKESSRYDKVYAVAKDAFKASLEKCNEKSAECMDFFRIRIKKAVSNCIHECFKEIADCLKQPEKYTPYQVEMAYADSFTLLLGTIHECIEKYLTHEKFKKQREEFVSAAKVAIMENLFRYNPEKAKPNTFFRPYIEHAAFLYFGQENMRSSYDNSSYIKLKELLNHLTQKGAKEKYTIVELAELSGYSIECVKRVLDDNSNTTYIQDFTEKQYENWISSSAVPSAENEMLKQMEDEELYHTIENLYGIPTTMFRMFCDYHGIFGDAMIYKELKVKYNLSVKEIRRKISVCTSMLLECPYFIKLFENKTGKNLVSWSESLEYDLEFNDEIADIDFLVG